MIDEAERRDAIAREASEWVIRHGGRPLTESERAAFQDWLAADAAHRTAFAQAQETWAELEGLRAQPGALRRVVAPPAKRGGGGKALIAVALLTAATIAGLWRIGDPRVALTADARTQVGETRELRLPDGSQVILGAASAIAVDFDEETRRVRLLTGEAVFAVAPRAGNERRPFMVEAEHGTTTALGTRFAVEELGDSVLVTAVEHRIAVSIATARGPNRTVLVPGGAVTYDRARGLGPPTRVDTANATAWMRGTLVFDGLPLRSAVARLNRYRRDRVVVVNGALAGRRVSGVFPIQDLDPAVDIIAAELGARTVSLPFVTFLY